MAQNEIYNLNTIFLLLFKKNNLFILSLTIVLYIYINSYLI